MWQRLPIKESEVSKKIWFGDPGINTLEDWEEYFKHINSIKFLMGDLPDKKWRADIDFLITYDNFIKIVEGKYIQ